MPTKKRKAREAASAEEKWRVDALVASAPAHIKARLGKPSQLASSLRDTYDFDGLRPTEDGEMAAPKSWGKGDPYGWRKRGTKANIERADETAQELRTKYGKRWGLPGSAAEIAKAEGKTERTIRNYYKRAPRQ